MSKKPGTIQSRDGGVCRSDYEELEKRESPTHVHLLTSFVSEHIETLEEIDVEYKELALKSGIENWGRVPALGCEPTFISDLADAVIESLPYVGAMAVSNLEARQSLVPLGSVEELLAAYDSKRGSSSSRDCVEWDGPKARNLERPSRHVSRARSSSL
ncbi:Ferrochelatase-2, chloroplastic [Ananas comosus]|uniref:Ferrochelatase-2, chloroplastic n=1 Tax=Ananas comosus TaxID=4615 RepID=A0A199UGT1_ANACO|nr:Ferrochelatase-2, chloroplastic [Ananas comosus]